MSSNKTRSNVLVVASSKHGATMEIADRISARLVESGLRATCRDADDVDRVLGYDAIVLGSAVYAGHWMKPAKELAVLIGQLDPPTPVWLFSSGPIGDPPEPDEDPVDVDEVMKATQAQEHRLFAGRLDRSKLGFGERAITTALRAPEGDFRDWASIDEWAKGIATSMTALAVGAD